MNPVKANLSKASKATIRIILTLKTLAYHLSGTMC
jgi:hypothetical protein